jgi:transposase
MDISVIGIDIAKSVFHVCGMDKRGNIVIRRKLTRKKIVEFIAQTTPTVVALEACAGAHFWARTFSESGHTVRLLPPNFVKPFVKSNKNDDRDAEGICEAAQRPTMRFVAAKTQTQQDIQCLHRVRDRLVRQKTALTNEIHGFLLEYGIVVRTGRTALQAFLSTQVDEHPHLSPFARDIFHRLALELKQSTEQICHYDRLIASLAHHPVAKRLMTIPGVGPLSATAILATVHDHSAYKNGRQFAASIGLCPRQHSSGGKTVLLGISKRGNHYVRRLLVHGARAVIKCCHKKQDRISRWLQQLIQRVGIHKAIVALANKNARIIWAVLATEQPFNNSHNLALA